MKKSKLYILIIVSVTILILTFFIYSKVTTVAEKNTIKVYDTENTESTVNDDDNKTTFDSNTLPTVTPKSMIAAVPIFMYHFMLDDTGTSYDVENFMPPQKFEEQVKYISENSYQTIYISEFDKLYAYSKPVALTFDDAFISVYQNAFPILKKYNQKATVFVITKFLDTQGYISTSQLKEMADSGLIDIQAHSQTHKHLSQISESSMITEVTKSQEDLKNILNKDYTVFSYPFGDYNQKVINEVKKIYKYAVAMDGGVYYSNRDNNYEISRIYANRSMSLNTFISYLKKSIVKVEL